MQYSKFVIVAALASFVQVSIAAVVLEPREVSIVTVTVTTIPDYCSTTNPGSATSKSVISQSGPAESVTTVMLLPPAAYGTTMTSPNVMSTLERPNPYAAGPMMLSDTAIKGVPPSASSSSSVVTTMPSSASSVVTTQAAPPAMTTTTPSSNGSDKMFGGGLLAALMGMIGTLGFLV